MQSANRASRSSRFQPRSSPVLIISNICSYRNGFGEGKYISIEKEIERSKETYYEALRASSIGWQDGENDYEPFVLYMLGVITACYKDLEKRMALMMSGASSSEVVYAWISDTLGDVTKQGIMDANPHLSQKTIERALQKLQSDGAIQKIGAARATRYRAR